MVLCPESRSAAPDRAAGARPEPFSATISSLPAGLTSTKQSPPMPVIAGFAQAEQNRARDGRVDGIAAGLQGRDGGLRGERMRRGADPVFGIDGRSARMVKVAACCPSLAPVWIGGNLPASTTGARCQDSHGGVWGKLRSPRRRTLGGGLIARRRGKPLQLHPLDIAFQEGEIWGGIRQSHGISLERIGLFGPGQGGKRRMFCPPCRDTLRACVSCAAAPSQSRPRAMTEHRRGRSAAARRGATHRLAWARPKSRSVICSPARSPPMSSRMA